ncbi:MAG: GTP-binding protein, partial [Variibacter sp.]|nr:GTP-binding protein [Variibacter sp.]
GVVTTVDAVNGAETLEREDISTKQVAVADRLIVTKSDLVGTEDTALRARLQALNAGAKMLAVDHGRVDPHLLFDVGPYDASARALDVASWLTGERTAEVHAHRHDQEIVSYVLVREQPIRAVTLALFLETLAEHCGGALLRLKGIVAIAESPERPAVIHGVQHVFHPPAWLADWPSDDRSSRMVFITRRIPPPWVAALLEALEQEVAEVAGAASR